MSALRGFVRRGDAMAEVAPRPDGSLPHMFAISAWRRLPGRRFVWRGLDIIVYTDETTITQDVYDAFSIVAKERA